MGEAGNASTASGWKPTGLAATAPARCSAQAQRRPSAAHSSLGHLVLFRHLYFVFRIGCSLNQLFGGLSQLCGRDDCCPPNSGAEQEKNNTNDQRHEKVKGAKCVRTSLFEVEMSERGFDTSLVYLEHAEREAQIDKLRRKIHQSLLET